MDGHLDTPPCGTVEERQDDFLMTPINAPPSIPIDASPVVLSSIPVKVVIEAMLNTSLDVLINVLRDVLTNVFVGVGTDAFQGVSYYAPLKSTPDAMLGKVLQFSQDVPSTAPTAQRFEIPEEVAADW